MILFAIVAIFSKRYDHEIRNNKTEGLFHFTYLEGNLLNYAQAMIFICHTYELLNFSSSRLLKCEFLNPGLQTNDS